METELYLMIIHGILHLLGYDHEKNEKEAKIMFDKQDYYSSKYIEEG
jgi:probable rRNA maturation factor